MIKNNEQFETNDFDYNLPNELIAQIPIKNRENSRLLYIDKYSKFHDLSFSNIINLVSKNDLIVFNNTKVINARFFGKKNSGGKIEILIEKIISNNIGLAYIKSNKAVKLNSVINLDDNVQLFINKRIDDLFEIQFPYNIYEIIEKYGQLPLPPYIKKIPDEIDQIRYQTIFAQKLGSVAAPTAGLHFTKNIIDQLKYKGVQIAFLTLHIGSGTFKPVKTKNINDHVMHSEFFNIPYETILKIINTINTNGKIIAVGTTTLRALEASANQIKNFNLQKFSNIVDNTNIFIKPGYKFQIINTLITNFHLPKSTLIMLVSALAGKKNIDLAYAHAISMKYQFFSYGDAMFIESPLCLI
ncbi:S-adenosylmethionine:tRNA ribosyltransferase-isomerase [Candidatus Kinetoplastibacterium sorsogonicusi]|uniref:S-adenosylmethionine:tRNA ribosyltransferase-isomerase n=1 Tax=Candidatus Kinetoplastidibacterium kentomonadis TaxID=1576550 RepID=A0A3S7J9B5_9PROT|nr:tRNA preQ1(34) S-adenosylmethionine ribosyltransferase-isomerase QueA [Candidatus Kinetoplastibacterium sorsogonicusi]AWD32260.1 S-adenosylmethionine:tRNA ribosyltransferase-isomerase [Candidatus Kinetoplastibacterium sorsogonicusi]